MVMTKTIPESGAIMSDQDNKKWSASISAKYDKKNETIYPELKLKDQIDENSDLNFTLDKNTIYAEYNLKF